MKKSTTYLILLFVLLSTVAIFVACNDSNTPSTTAVEYLPFDIDKTGTIQRFYATETNSVNVSIPSTYSIDMNGKIIAGTAYEIKSIGKYCFANNNLLESVTIPETVTSIQDNAFFNCSNIQKINIGKNICSIGEDVFELCPKLTQITKTGTNGIILEYNENLNTFNAPSSVVKIDDNSFENWENLTSITITNNITHIGNNAFLHCSNLKNVIINSSLEFIADTAFSDCEQLTVLSSTSSSGNGIYFSQPQSVKRFVIPDSITSIQAECFFKWTKLEYISLPQSITYIGTIFNDNNNLTTLICGTSSILSLFTYSYDATETETTYIASHHIIPKTLKEVRLLNDMSSDCFSGMKSLEVVHIPSSVTEFGSATFAGCSNLTNVYLSTDSDWIYSTYSATKNISQTIMNNPRQLASLIREYTENYILRKA